MKYFAIIDAKEYYSLYEGLRIEAIITILTLLFEAANESSKGLTPSIHIYFTSSHLHSFSQESGPRKS